MSRYQPSYDSNESRRSPRDQSPGRYNDSRDDFRSGPSRGGERRRSIPDARTNNNAFNSNRDLFRDSVGSNSSRDFPSREPPRGPGPKGVPDAPTGPRASSNYGDSHRGDFGGGYSRPEYRGERGRGRARVWRDDSRDRSRDIDRDYRDRRDDRGPPYRDRDRWNREPFRGGRRASSPQGRGRSPTYNSRDTRDTRDIRDTRDLRDTRDARETRDTRDSRDIRDTRDPPPNLDIDRSRRGSRDGPPSGGSPSSDTPQPFYRGGYGRGRARGGRVTRGGYYDEGYHRPQGRSRSPENHYGRRTQPSATPPPQVPAFGSNTPAAPASIGSGPVPGVAVPTAPRSERSAFKAAGGLHHSRPLIFENSKKEFIDKSDAPTNDTLLPIPFSRPPGSTQTIEPQDSASIKVSLKDDESKSVVPEPIEQQPAVAVSQPEAPPKRRPIIGKRPPKPRKLSRQDDTEETSDIDSGDDDLDDKYFENEIQKINDEIALAEKAENPLIPRTLPAPLAVFLQPFIDFAIDDLIAKTKAATVQACIAPEIQEESVPEPLRSASLAPIPQSKSKSRPTTPFTESLSAEASNTNDQESTVRDGSLRAASERSTSVAIPPTLYSATEGEEDVADTESSEPLAKPTINGSHQEAVPMIDRFDDDSEGDLSAAEREEELQAVRKMMKTPSISSLPNFGKKKWFEDPELLKDLEPKPEVEQRIKQHLLANKIRVEQEQEAERQAWKKRYIEYRQFTDSDDPAAVRSREKFAKSRAKTAAEVMAPNRSVMASAGTGKPEGTRRGGRFATEHDFERVLRESEQEAKESKEREERTSRAKTADAKEAKIPNMIWDPEEKQRLLFLDESRKIPFERSFALLEYGEPIDNFNQEEREIFERVYVEHPKEWHTIAAALPQRDFKACIQHYYLVKHSSNLKDKVKGTKKSTKKKPRAKNARANGLIADPGGNDPDEGQDPENGERRRPRRAAAPVFNFETPASESEVASPAPTPGRKPGPTPKAGNGADAPPKQKKTRTPREKGQKQPKNSQLLAAAPPANPRAESPATPSSASDWKNRRESSGTPRFPPAQFDGPGTSQPFVSSLMPIDRPNPTAPANFEATSSPLPIHERLGSAPPLSFDSPQDRGRNSQQQTSSYWSVPEQTDFPALLRHFGTDWHGIAKHMTSKTHIMVKNYYQRQVDSGKYKEYEEIAKEADEKRARGESTGPPPPPTIIPKRRYDVTPGPIPRAGSAMEAPEELLPTPPAPTLAQASPPQPQSLSTRFPALAQAGPVPQIPSAPSSSSILAKHLPPQHTQQAPPTIQLQSRPPRGPPLGYFNTDPPPRPVVQSDAVSQRSLMVAQEAQMERQSALRLVRVREQREQQQQAIQREQQQAIQREQQQAMQREQQQAMQREQQQAMQREQQQQAVQREQQQQQQQARREQEQALQREQQLALQRERQFPLKQETEMNGLQHYEPYAPPQQKHANNPPPPRIEAPKPVTPLAPEPRRNTQPQQYQPQPRLHQSVRTLITDIPGREIKSSPSPAVQRAPMSAPPTSQEQYSAPPQPAPVTAVRQQETVRKTSSIMSLLNEEPSDPRPTPPKRVSDVASAPPSSHTPPPHHQSQPPRYSHTPQASSQSSSQPPPQITSQAPSQQQLAHAQHPYAASAQRHPMHQHSSSIGQQRSYTPTSYENRGYAPPPIQTQQQVYSQPPRQQMSSQPPPIRREASLGDIHGISGGYARTSATLQQPTSRLKESPYSATPPPQGVRQSAASPHDIPSSERDYYPRSNQQYLAQQQQQQQSATASPQAGPSYSGASPSTYHPQQQQPAAHLQLAFGQASSRLASPPSQYASQHQLHSSRDNSFDSRHQMVVSSAPGPAQQSYTQAPQPQGAPLSMQYQPQHPSHERYDYDRERERRLQEDVYNRRRAEEHRQLEERRRPDDSRR